jgi:hypothetical protein
MPKKNMKDEQNKIKEPYHPDKTPNPPQIIDPSKRNEDDRKEAPVENKQRENKNESQSENPKLEKPKQLGESEPDIHDETTI